MSTKPLLNYPSLNFVRTLLTILFLGTLLNACDKNDNNKKNNFTIKQKIQKYSKDTTIKGKVSDKKGVIHFGDIKATDSSGKLVASTQLENDSLYNIKIPSGTELPITLTYFPNEKSTKKEKLISVAIHTSIKKYDINELTTRIAKKAKSLGGYTHANMVLAAESTVNAPDANKTTAGFKGDPTKQYGGWH